MWWLLAVVVVIAVLAFVLQRRGATFEGQDDRGDARRPPESFKIPGSGGGNSGGFAG
jgi:hypothetical protein